MSIETDREALAELLSWTSGDMTRYSDTAHPDHNRWSWRGTGHGRVVREEFLAQANDLLDTGLVYVHGSKALEARLAEERAAVLREAAEDLDADLISMAAGGRGLTRTILLGSTASRVQHSAPCPVLVCRPTATSERVTS